LDGHARTAGRIIQTLTVEGKEYTLRAPSIGRLIADMEGYIASLRQNPFVTAAKACAELPEIIPTELRAAMEERIWKSAESASVRSGAVSAVEMNEFTDSPRGLAYQLMTCLEADHGEEIATVDDALSLMERFIEDAGEEGIIELKAKVMAATGEGDAKNSSGPNRKRSGKEKAQDRRKRNSQAGRASTNSLPKSITLPHSK